QAGTARTSFRRLLGLPWRPAPLLRAPGRVTLASLYYRCRTRRQGSPHHPGRKRLAAGALILVLGLSSSNARAADRPAAETFDATACRTLFALSEISIPHTQKLRDSSLNTTAFSGDPTLLPRLALGLSCSGDS